MSIKMTRRHALTGLAALGLGAVLPVPAATPSTVFQNSIASGDEDADVARLPSVPVFASTVFQHGVASGDPSADGIVLWTRVTGGHRRQIVRWALATDPGMQAVVQSGRVITHDGVDRTVKIQLSGLLPGVTYYYRFETRDAKSPVGRTRTLPRGSLQTLGIALVSCSNYPFGYFNVYDAIANDDQVEFVLHLGDYLYEYGDPGYGSAMGARLGRRHEPAHETVSLDDYRTRHAQYKADADSQAMHAAHPLIPVWDDHESANNPWRGGAQNHQAPAEGDWGTRRAASLRAYYEWMPIRNPRPGADPSAYWRTMEFGDLATLITLETRHTARSRQIDYADHLPHLKTKQDIARFVRDVLGDPHRQMISAEMEADLRNGLAAARAAGHPWRLIGNQTPMARLRAPRLEGVDLAAADGYQPLSEPRRRQLAMLGQLRLPPFLDDWSGYSAARQRFYELAQAVNVRDLLVLTGDSHSFWTNQLFDDNNVAMGLELGTTGVTSPSGYERFTAATANRLEQLIADASSEVIWTENSARGYIRLALAPEQVRADFMRVSTITSSNYDVAVLRSVHIRHSGDTLHYVS